MVNFHILFILLCSLVVLVLGENNLKLSRDDFPSDFVFGAGTSAYQYEGAAAEDGRTPSIWDTFTHAGNMPDHSTGDVASEGYHKYKEDVKLMSEVGLEAYRFSISWSRLLPNGRGRVNPKTLKYYNNDINELVNHGIELHATLSHLDLPQILEDEYEGWLSPKIVEDFTAFADMCFREFGDRISRWTTINEPNIMAISSYSTGMLPPQRCSPPGGLYNCSAGNSSVEPYKAMHHILLAQSSIVAMYRDKYQAKQNGLVGLNVYALWFTPMTNSTIDVRATQRAIDFYIGWVVNPVIYGDYPDIMKKNVGSRMPSFTKRESELLKGSFDFIGLNHYVTMYVEDGPHSPNTGPRDFDTDLDVKLSVTKEGTESPPGPFVPSSLPCNPSGMKGLLEYFKDHYGNPPVYIQENGYGAPYNETLDDTARINYLSGYMDVIQSAISNGTNAKGYFVWSFLDVFEFLSGYTSRYGLVHVDFEDKELKRQLKSSANWYSNFLKKRTLVMKNADKDERNILRRIKRNLMQLDDYKVGHHYRETNRDADYLAGLYPSSEHFEIATNSYAEDLKKIVFVDAIGKAYIRM